MSEDVALAGESYFIAGSSSGTDAVVHYGCIEPGQTVTTAQDHLVFFTDVDVWKAALASRGIVPWLTTDDAPEASDLVCDITCEPDEWATGLAAPAASKRVVA